MVDGGISKYVWSIDGGKTWQDCGGVAGTANNDMISLGQSITGATFSDVEATKVNGSFQGHLSIDLSGELGNTVDVIFAAVPKVDESTLVLIYCFENVKPGVESIFAEGSEYLDVDLAYGAQIDSLNGTNVGKESGTKNGVGNFRDTVVTNENGQLSLKGWCALDGGVSKYVWTADNGKTWHDCAGKVGNAYNDIINEGQKRADATFGNHEASKLNGEFQGDPGIVIDLTEYAGSENTLKIVLCAVPANMTDRVVVLYTFENVISPAKAE